MNTSDYRIKFNKLQVQKDLLKKDLKTKNTELLNSKDQFENLIKAQDIIQIVAQQTQNEIKFFITDIVNLALNSIPFENKPDSFEMEFTVRRNQTECDLFYLQDNKRLNPLLSSGGGILDITSLALIIACWSLQSKKNNTIIFDEGLKYLSENLRSYAGDILKKISEKLDLQIIFVTHQKEYFNIADKIFIVGMDNNISKIKSGE